MKYRIHIHTATLFYNSALRISKNLVGFMIGKLVLLRFSHRHVLTICLKFRRLGSEKDKTEIYPFHIRGKPDHSKIRHLLQRFGRLINQMKEALKYKSSFDGTASITSDNKII